MKPWFIATRRFGPECGEAWESYVRWSGLGQLSELVSLDPILCPPVLDELKAEYWPHIVNEDFMLSYFVDYDFMMEQVAGVRDKNVLCVVRDPAEPGMECLEGFEFLGYDLVDVQNSASALTNCGGFPEVFGGEELSCYGLLTDFHRVREVQRELRERFPGEAHANCYRWAIARLKA